MNHAPAARGSATRLLRMTIRGAVQGVGFRPFVYRLASELKINGWVSNSAGGVCIEAEGEEGVLEEFRSRIESDPPGLSSLESLDSTLCDPVGYGRFEIRESLTGGEPTAFVLPDIATCPDCLREILDPADRRYLYPFTNCTRCGPRLTIIESLPYDRRGTTMKRFRMCRNCREEYENPADRRFHAQPNACPDCGPRLELWDPAGLPAAGGHEALLAAAEEIRNGRIVAVKGIGGFQLLADARNEEAILRLRDRKRREDKPLAVMMPSVETAFAACHLSESELLTLCSPAAPIVLLRRTAMAGEGDAPVAASVAPGNPLLGIMLPYSPLHHLLMRELGFPVVATSGNISDEPMCVDEREALKRLHGIADVFLVHNRPIVRSVDDSVVRIVMNRELMLRRARGYAPMPVSLNGRNGARGTPRAAIAVGGHQKSTIGLAAGGNAFISQHIGDLDTAEAVGGFRRTMEHFRRLYNSTPDAVVTDLHPDYASTRIGRELGAPVLAVQHHYAHVASCMAEHRLTGSLLGVAWDGSGYGGDGTIWGGEFLRTHSSPLVILSEAKDLHEGFDRCATFRQFPLPGGERAVREPRRQALGLLYELFGDSVFERKEIATLQSFSGRELKLLRNMLRNRLNTPSTSSAGRLFDAVASLLNFRQTSSFEGQAAMELEFSCHSDRSEESTAAGVYDYDIQPGAPLIVDWEPMITGIIRDIRKGIPAGIISSAFHNTLAGIIVDVAGRIGEPRVVLSGGCFQNAALLERTVKGLSEQGFKPFWHRWIPPNDGGISLGQLYAVCRLSVEGGG